MKGLRVVGILKGPNKGGVPEMSKKKRERIITGIQ